MKKTISFIAACIGALFMTSAGAVEVAHYAFEGDFTDSVTADGAQDLTGAGGVATASPGFVGGSLLLLDGFDDRVTGTADYFSGVSGLTLTTWFSPGSPITGAQTEDYTLIQLPINGGASLSQSTLGLEIQDGALQVGGRSSPADGFQRYLSPTLLTMDKTYFAAVTLDFAAKRIDGYLFDVADDIWEAGVNDSPVWAESTSAGNNGISIGRRADNQRFFKGSIDDVRLFTHVLTEAELQAIAGYEPPPSGDGDYDGDNDVDGADLLTWQRGESPNALSASDLDAWRQNFGTSGPGSVANVVPEPTSAVLLGSVIVSIIFRRRPR